MHYRKEIDGLRALALLSVIFFHAGVPQFSGGFVGVDVFFVISGYLVTTVLIQEKNSTTFSIKQFYERRVRRIAPALFFTLLVSKIFAWFLLSPSEMKAFSLSLIAVSTFTANVLFYLTTGYFQTAAELSPLLHTWSLAVEEQYYIFFPLFLSLTWKFGKPILIIIIAVMAFASFGLAQWGSTHAITSTFYLLPTRAWELLCGALISFCPSYERKLNKNTLVFQIFSVIGLILICVPFFVFNRKTPFPSVYTLAPVIGSMMVIFFANAQNDVGKLLGNRILVGIGLISYSSYLWHQPILVFSRKAIDMNDITAVSSTIGLSLLAGYLSWRFVEQPFRRKKSFNTESIFYYSGGMSILFIAIGLVGYFTDGFKDRFISIDSLQATHSENFQRVDECFLIQAEANAFVQFNCAKTDISAQYNVLLIGDSHAASLYPGLNNYLQSNNVHLSMMTAGYCLPLVEHFPKNSSLSATARCEKINQSATQLLSGKKFDLIIISSFILHWGFRDYWNSSVPSYPGYLDNYLNKIKAISSNNKILIVGQFLTWPNELPNVIYQEAMNSRFRNISDVPMYSSFGIDDKLFQVDRFLKADADREGLRYISIVDFLCNTDRACMRFVPTETGPHLISPDYGHLVLEASKFLSDNIVGPEVLKLLHDKVQ